MWLLLSSAGWLGRFLDQLEEYLSTSVEEVIDFYGDAEVEIDEQECSPTYRVSSRLRRLRRDMSLEERQRHFADLLGMDVAEAVVECTGQE